MLVTWRVKRRFCLFLKTELTNWSNNSRLTLKKRSTSIRPKGDEQMEELKLGAVESKFADIIWDNEPISSGRLVKLCEQRLEWKKSTTYTMLKRLCERGLFQNEKGIVSSVMTREEFGAAQSEKIIEESFDGSLPAFIAAFASRRKLSSADVAEIQKMIDAYREE